MTTQEYLCRHFVRVGARVVLRGPRRLQRTKIAIDVGRDRSGELFVIGCEDEIAIEVLDVQARSHHMVFAAAVPGDGVRDVLTALANLRPKEIEGREAIRQGEWFFVPKIGVNDKDAVILRNEPLSRGGGSKPHICTQMMRRGGETVMVCSRYRRAWHRRVPDAHLTQSGRAAVRLEAYGARRRSLRAWRGPAPGSQDDPSLVLASRVHEPGTICSARSANCVSGLTRGVPGLQARDLGTSFMHIDVTKVSAISPVTGNNG
jgi:hypothetical protein